MTEMGATDVPLAPGKVPLAGHLPRLVRDRTAFLQELRGCGDIVEMRLGRRSFFALNSPEAIHDVLVVQSMKFSKGMLFDRVRPYMGNGIATSDGPFHLRQRRAMQPAFHREQIARYSEMFADIAQARVGGWPEGRLLAMDREMRALAVSMLIPTLFPAATGSATGQAIEDTTLSWALHVLAQNPQLADRMSEETRAAEPGIVTCAALPYTSRFVQEILRLHQPLWFMGRRALETVRVGQFELPPGAEVVYSAATLHRDPAYFPDPLRFDPDRWLTQPETTLPRSAYLPFGSGSRKCIGEHFARAEMLAVLSAITRRWHLHPAPGHTVRAVADAQIPPDALPISVRPRAAG